MNATFEILLPRPCESVEEFFIDRCASIEKFFEFLITLSVGLLQLVPKKKAIFPLSSMINCVDWQVAQSHRNRAVLIHLGMIEEKRFAGSDGPRAFITCVVDCQGLVHRRCRTTPP